MAHLKHDWEAFCAVLTHTGPVVWSRRVLASNMMYCPGGSEGAAVGYQVKQLEQQNERMKEALVKFVAI